MKILLVCSLLILFLFCSAFGQEKPVIYVLKGQDRIELRIDFLVQPEEFIRRYATDINNYYFYEVKKGDDVSKHISEELVRIGKFDDLDRVKLELTNLTTQLNAPPANLLKPGSVVESRADGQHLRLTLSNKLEYNRQYILKIRGLDLSKKTPPASNGQLKLKTSDQPNNLTDEVPVASVNFSYADPTADIVPSLNVYDQNQIRVVSTGPLQSDSTVTVVRKTLRVNPDLTGLDPVPDPITATRGIGNDNVLTFDLNKKFYGGTPYSLSIPDGITDGTKPVEVKGAIKFPSGPGPADTPKIDIGLSSIAAVHQKGVLELNLKATPTKPQPLGAGWFGETKLEADIGLRSTKSANSIKLAYLFRKRIYALPMSGRLKDNDTLQLPNGQLVKTTIPRYANWATTEWYKPSTLYFFVGPKFETDRKFRRINTLANVRFDFGFHRWIGSMTDRRGLFKDDFLADPEIKKENKNDYLLIDIPFGLRIIPSLGFDIGGRLNNETVTNEKKKVSVMVPRHNIFRVIPALTGTVEWRTYSLPTTLTIDESVSYLAATEQIGFTTDDGVGLRRIRGFQPRFVTSLEFALDHARHYNFVIKYENGRSAPNFEYLNKITTGINVKFGSADQSPATRY